MTTKPLAAAELGADALQAIGRPSDGRALRTLCHELKTCPGPMALLAAAKASGDEREALLDLAQKRIDELRAPKKAAPKKASKKAAPQKASS